MGNEEKPTVEPYSPVWFTERAFNSLKKISDRTWDYSDSLLLYAAGEAEADYESFQKGEDPYAKLITEPERAYLEKIADNVVAELPDEFEFIDLGPGTAHKEQFIFDAAKRAGKTFSYRPVDISPHYLKLAADYASNQGIPTEPMRCAFEELAEKLGPTKGSRFVSLGLTFINYHPREVLTLLQRIAGPNGTIFINTQIRERIDMEKITGAYNRDVKALASHKLKLIGLDPERDVAEMHADDGVRIWCTLKNSTPELEKRGVMAGDRLLVLQSIRYSKDELGRALDTNGSTYQMLDTGGPFIGTLIKT